MAKMISMKGVGKAPGEMMASRPEEDEYPWGLQLHLGNEELEALGIDMLPDVGGKRMMMARVEVSSTNRREEGGEIHRSVDLQITDLKLTEDEKPAEKVMYGGDDEERS